MERRKITELAEGATPQWQVGKCLRSEKYRTSINGTQLFYKSSEQTSFISARMRDGNMKGKEIEDLRVLERRTNE
ncbi:predicted protein [Sclerotinia sclerotiorum 1980 UF-70]|uniref:Uncharacterized protein n=1 Tax=Sclerotinia sclerotiorum (strain ATCC 18683 / 1980 / Ss-1) TaxID=665079 RepID=A7F6I7_SCLS1|nr:predicted protein [Sclerotinia sclerotiorum 1980 UF-70]EDN98358.1 predicted protein [Sclerotinia sclerotiorum 1980 UF-70]